MDTNAEPLPIPFSFAPRWKEEMVCRCPLGSFVIEMPMGITTVYLPTAARWAEVAPAWAQPHWETLHEQLLEWCRIQRTPLVLDAKAFAYDFADANAASTGE